MSVAVYDALNTAIYKAVTERPSLEHSLDQYLLALWKLGCAYRKQPHIPAQEFVDLLALALVSEAPAEVVPMACEPGSEFAHWQNCVLGFARDFAEVKDLPQDDPFEFHGWMNTQPGSYLERGAACTFGEGELDDVSWEDFCNLLSWGKYYE